MARWTLIALAVCLVSTSAYPHGSSYRGPSGGVPPGLRTPPDPMSPSSAPTGWEKWWSFSKEEFLYPDSMGNLTHPAPPADADVVGPVLAAFTKALTDKMSCPERSRVAIAAGCFAAGTGRFPDALRERIRELSGDRDQQTIVQASCALALGLSLTDDPRTLTWLMDLALDAAAGPEVRGAAALALGFLRPADGSPARRPWTATLEQAANFRDAGACALLAMGISGDPAFLPFLTKAIRTTGIGDDALCYATTGLGRLAEVLPDAPTDAVIAQLCRTATGKNATGAAVVALGHWASRPDAGIEALGATLDLLAEASAKKPRGSIAGHALVAAARLGAATHHRKIRIRAREFLSGALEPAGGGIHPPAAIALGVFGRSPNLEEEMRTDIADGLRSHLIRLNALVDPNVPISCVATPPAEPTPPPEIGTPGPGGPGASPPEATPPSAPDGAQPTTTPTGPKADPSAQAAIALALALIGDRDSIPAIRELSDNPGAVRRARGHAAVALALLGDPELPGTLRYRLPGCPDADLLVLGSLAGGLSGDQSLFPEIAPLIRGPSPTALSKSLVARALGKLGDSRAMPDLTGILLSEKNGGGLRSAAAVALADLFDRRGALVLTRLTRDLDWGSLDSTIRMLLRAL